MEPDPFASEVARLGPVLLGSLEALEGAARHLDPAGLEALRESLEHLRGPLAERRAALAGAPVPEALEVPARALLEAADRAGEALAGLCGEGPTPAPADGFPEPVARILGALSSHCRACERIYPLRAALPPVSRFFLEAPVRGRLETLDPSPPAQERTGIFHASNALGQRGGFSLYVPESVAAGEARPLVIALHGGGGHGRDFLWTWLREARSRRCLLLAPTSRGSTWSLHGPDLDARSLVAMVERVGDDWAIDRGRLLLTGLSDGATYTLLHGLAEGAPYAALAPLSGVLHPASSANGNLGRAAGRRIYLVHGERDWMFPVALARAAARALREAGAELVYREVPDLSHAYAREQNAAILDWFDPETRLAEVG